MECLCWPAIRGDCRRSDITGADLHGAAQSGPTQYTDCDYLGRWLLYWPDKLLEPCSERRSQSPLLVIR